MRYVLVCATTCPPVALVGSPATFATRSEASIVAGGPGSGQGDQIQHSDHRSVGQPVPPTAADFDALPAEMRNDTAFMDRIHAFLPGWAMVDPWQD